MMKRVLLILLGVLLLPVLIIVFVGLINPTEASQDLSWNEGTQVLPLMDEGDFDQADIDSLRALVGDNKIIPKRCELPALIALSHYPYLKDYAVEFQYTSSGAPLESRPKIGSLFGPSEKRKFMVYLNTQPMEQLGEMGKNILLDNLPFQGKIGVLAHELGHTNYYAHHDLAEMIGFGLRFFTNTDYAKKHERTTDKKVIYQGLGNYLYQYAAYVRSQADQLPQEIKQQMESYELDEYYLNDEAVKEVMAQIPAYQSH